MDAIKNGKSQKYRSRALGAVLRTGALVGSLCLLLVCMPAAGQVPASSLAEDAKDDVVLRVKGNAPLDLPLQPVANIIDGPDLKSLHAGDDDRNMILLFGFHPADNQLDVHSVRLIGMNFTAGKLVYQIEVNSGGGTLYLLDAVGGRHSIAELNGGALDNAQWYVEVPRERILDESGAPPERGTQLLLGTVFATGPTTRLAASEMIAFDEMPVALPFIFEMGLDQTGPGQLVLVRRAVSSNGEGAAHAFPFEVRNTDDSPHLFELTVSELPYDSWTPSFTRVEIPLDGNGVFSDTLVVTVPFAHQHGDRDEFWLTLNQLDGSSTSQARLSIYYFAIPQLTGHHDTLFLHVREQPSSPDLSAITGDAHWLYMNTLAQDPDATMTPVSPPALQFPVERYEWRIILSPELAVPLSFDDSSSARLRTAFTADTPQTNVKVGANLLLQGVELDNEVIVFPPISVDNLAMSEQSVELTGTVSKEFIDTARGTNLELVVYMTVDAPLALAGAQTPSMLPGGELELPLLEYRASTGASEAKGLALMLGNRSLRLPPGQSGQLEGLIENNNPVPVHVEYEIQGINASWFEIPPGVDVQRATSEPVSFWIIVPPNANDGDIADVIVKAVRDDGSSVAERILVVVSSTSQGQARTASSSEAPATSMVLVLGALWSVVGLLRRRRHS